MAENKLISIGGLQHYHEKASEIFSPKVHTHQASEVIENSEKRFVTDEEKTSWSDKYTKQEIDDLINGIVKLTIQTVDTLPESGQENILYLVPVKTPDEENRNIKEEYLWINGKWELIGTTAPEEAQVFKANKTSLETSDNDVIENYFTTNSGVKPIPGDVFVIKTIVDDKIYEYSSYMYDESRWIAITGNVDASKVILRGKILLAGNYTQLGNISKGINETKELDVDGISLTDFHKQIFTAKLQPENPTQPSVSGFSLSGAKAVEAGTKLASVTLTAANLSPGSYQYGPATGVTAQSWKIDRVTNVSSLNTKIADANSATDNNGGAGFIIGDQGGDNVVNSLKYTVTATHNEGAVAHDNLGGESNPPKKITAGTKTQTTSAYTPFRQYFYGATSEKPTLDSSYIRGLTPSNKAYTRGTFNLTVPPGSTRVSIACVSTAVGVTRVINTTALNADVTETFVKQTVQVAGANDYAPINYNVWVFEPAEAYGQQAILQVTLG